jgi:hypothetical protein
MLIAITRAVSLSMNDCQLAFLDGHSGWQRTGVRRTRQRLSDAHLLQVVGELLAAGQADNIGIPVRLGGRADRCDRAGEVLMRTAQYQIEDGVDHGHHLALETGRYSHFAARSLGPACVSPHQSRLDMHSWSSPKFR